MHTLPIKTPAYLTGYGIFSEEHSPTFEYNLIRVLTDEGIEGDYIAWGEIASARSGALTDVLRVFKPYLVGEDPLNREKIWQNLGRFWYGQKGPAFAAIDIALWDIAGKLANLPIYKLLGAYRNKIKAYASGVAPLGKENIKSLAIKLKERGYKAIKFHPIPVEEIKTLRETVGDEISLIFDAMFAYDRHKALKIGKELEKLNFHWYEAPLPANDIEGYVELCKKLDIPITVEVLHNFTEYIRRKAIDIFRTFTDFVGGITEMRKTASLCEMFGLNVEPHSWGGSLCQAANLHVMLSIKNCEFFELPIDENGNEGMFDVGTKDTLRIDKEGYVHAPKKPGLGLEIDWDLVEKGTEIKL